MDCFVTTFSILKTHPSGTRSKDILICFKARIMHHFGLPKIIRSRRWPSRKIDEGGVKKALAVAFASSPCASTRNVIGHEGSHHDIPPPPHPATRSGHRALDHRP